MKITARMTDNGIQREVDFQGAKLPDGRRIDDVLNENKGLKENVAKLTKNLKEGSSILTTLIPNRVLRIIIEAILIIGTIIGIILLFR